MFRKESMKKVFDTLHGIGNDIDVHVAVEMIRSVFKLILVQNLTLIGVGRHPVSIISKLAKATVISRGKLKRANLKKIW